MLHIFLSGFSNDNLQCISKLFVINVKNIHVNFNPKNALVFETKMQERKNSEKLLIL